jgi:methionyl-tRNA formyltransferase
MRTSPSAVKALALRHGIEVLQPAGLRDAQMHARLAAIGADAMIVAAYGLLLPPPALAVARHGAINIHASLLPRWRGAAPIQRALLAGDRETGVSIMQMDEGLDTGPVFAERRVPILADDDSGSLHDKLADLGAQALLDVLADIAAGRAQAKAQSEDGATYARKIDKQETLLRWDRPASELERAVRAFRPAPGASARLAGASVKLWRARVVPGKGAPGTLLEQRNALIAACGSDALAIEELQPAGARRMSAADFLRGRALSAGSRFE